ncbi:imidazole glycerol phosphate synthase subunit HisH [soil metagenome]
MSEIVILDYGMANLRSVQKAFEAVGHAAVITSDPLLAAKAERLVLPGVGAFQDAIAKVRSSGLDRVVIDHIAADKPFLGICLGLQLLFDRSFEDGIHEGLGIVKGDVVRFVDQPGIKVPHMGWNSVKTNECPLFAGLEQESSVYFVHGYYAVPADVNVVAGWTDYPTPFASVLWKKNLFATQFHPEKSQRVGLQMLKNFATE